MSLYMSEKFVRVEKDFTAQLARERAVGFDFKYVLIGGFDLFFLNFHRYAVDVLRFPGAAGLEG